MRSTKCEESIVSENVEKDPFAPEPKDGNPGADPCNRPYRELCEGLAKISESTAWQAEADRVYQRMIDTVAGVLQCSEVHMHLMTSNSDGFVKCAAHLSEKNSLASEWSDLLPATVGRMRLMMSTHRPIVMDYRNPHADDRIPLKAVSQGFRSAVSIPLVSDGVLMGMVSAVYKIDTSWGEESIEYLVQVGRVLGTAIGRMQATKKAAELQALDDRRRLSTEIHENISQLVSAISLNAAAALASYEERDWAGVHDDLQRLEESSGTMMRVLRSEMLSLRVPLEREDGLVEGVEEVLHQIESVWGLKTEYEVKSTRGGVVVSLDASMQLMRILDECLLNTLRHAKASRVSVTLAEDPESLSMTVSDDGCGFDLGSVAPDHLGLKIMAERAATVGGKLTIVSDPQGGGTMVRICIPAHLSRRMA